MKIYKFFLVLGLVHSSFADQQKCYINMHLGGRLGNQMFQIATALSLAKDFGSVAIFPDLMNSGVEDFRTNRKHFFPSIRVEKPQKHSGYIFREDEHFHFRPIPFHPYMEVFGYFQSEKYFKHNKTVVSNAFAPSKKITDYLEGSYPDILAHPNTVAIHLRAYKLESLDIENCFPFLSGKFYAKAAEFFPDDALFVIFSDRIDWAREEMRDFSRPHIFIENEPHYHDFYLMSLCKHQIISASSFSWWAAYLNTNPGKRVIAPDPWFSPVSRHDSSNVIPDDWQKLSWQEVN